jgi:hypothetical protein
MPAYLTAKQPGTLRADHTIRDPSSGHPSSAIKAPFSVTLENG